MTTKKLLVISYHQAREVDPPKGSQKVYTIISQLENIDTKQQHFLPIPIVKPDDDCVYECQTNEELMTCTLGTQLTFKS